MKKNSTKRSLLASVLALVMCVSMLVGTTFAWFTDTASTGVNKIQAGTLDVALEMKDDQGNWVSAEGKTLQFKVNGQIPAAGTQILWEPGCTYELPELRVVNKGNLALKYKIAITGIHGDAKLNEAIDWTLKLNNEDFNYDIDAEHSLAAGANHPFTIKGHMREDAGNEYQGLSIDNIAITVIATQDTVESDSINNNYDSSAAYCEWPVVVNQAVAKDSSGNITDQTLTKYVASDVQAQVTVPAAAVDTNAEQITLTVEKTTAPANFTVAAGQDSKTYDVKVTGLAADNVTPVKAKLFVGIGLTGVTLIHNGNDSFTHVSGADALTDKTFYYNPADGYLYFATTSFSPFSAAFDAPAGVSGAGTLKETYYTTVADAQAAADEGKTVTALQNANNVQVGDKTESIEKGETFKIPVALHRNVKYYSVADAVKARGTSGSINTIELLRDVTENITLNGYTTLELNGKTVTGNVSIKDYDSLQNGTVNGTVTTSTKAAPSNNDKNKVLNCTVTKFELANGCNRENVVIENSTIGEVQVGNRYYSSGSAGLLTFVNSHVTGNITVGTATKPYNSSMASGWGFGSKVRFLGGTYDGTITLQYAEKYHNKIEIVTGTFLQDVPAAFLNSGSAVKQEGGKYIAYKLPVAKVGSTEYQTIEDACAAAMAGDDHKVTVLCDGNVETTVEVNGTLIFDLNGHTVQAAPPNNRAFYIKEDGNLTIDDSSKAKTGLLESISSFNAETVYFQGGNSSLTVNGGTIKSSGQTVTSAGTVKAGYAITVNGGKIWSTGNSAISLNANAPVTFRMDGGEMIGNSYSGTIFTGTYGTGTHTFTFMDGTINRNGSYNLYISTGDGVNTVVNIARNMDVKCNTGDGITVNNNYAG